MQDQHAVISGADCAKRPAVPGIAAASRLAAYSFKLAVYSFFDISGSRSPGLVTTFVLIALASALVSPMA